MRRNSDDTNQSNKRRAVESMKSVPSDIDPPVGLVTLDNVEPAEEQKMIIGGTKLSTSDQKLNRGDTLAADESSEDDALPSLIDL